MTKASWYPLVYATTLRRTGVLHVVVTGRSQDREHGQAERPAESGGHRTAPAASARSRIPIPRSAVTSFTANSTVRSRIGMLM
jgi:hypothetical protein